MASNLNVTIFMNPSDNVAGKYLVELREGEKTIAQEKVFIDQQALLEHEHQFSAHDYGMELYDAIFTKAVSREYQKLVSRAGAESTVRMQLVISEFAAELHRLPWERLFHVFGGIDAPLAASAQTPFSRFLITGAGDQSPLQERPLRLLVAIANPENLPQEFAAIEVEREVATLADVVYKLQGRVVGTLLSGGTGLPAALQKRLEQQGWQVVGGATSWKSIQRHLSGKHVVHVLAHGQFRSTDSTTYLLLEDEGTGNMPSGGVHRVADHEIMDGLKGVHPLPHIVFLAACESATRPQSGTNPFVGLGPKLVGMGVPAVIAMQDLVPMELAHSLTADFYRRLFEHGQVDRALNEARNLVFERDQFEWAIPVLFSRLQNGRLFSEQSLEPPQRVIFDSLIDEYTRLFAGREVILAELEQFMAEPSGGYLIVRAEAGLGKTALMSKLVATHRTNVAYHFFTPRISESLQEDIFLRNILEQIGPWYGINDPLTGQLNEMRKRYDALLSKAPQGRCTIVLDGLDETAETTIDLSRYLTRNLPAGLHFILTVRDIGQDLIAEFALPAEQVRSMHLTGLAREGVQAVFRAAGGNALQFAENDMLLEQVLRVTVYDEARPEFGADTLFVRFLAEDAASGTLTAGKLAELPPRMAAYLDRWWQAIRAEFGEEGDRKKRQQAMVDLAGTLAAALGPMSQGDLEAINSTLVSDIEQNFIDTVVKAVDRIIVRNARGEYTLLHPRLRQYLQQKLKTARYTQRIIKYCAQWHTYKSRYALTYYAAHLAAAAGAAQPARHTHTEHLLRLVIDHDYQDMYLEQVQDLRGLQANIQRGLEVACSDDCAEALPLIIEGALSLQRFRRERLRPEPIFDMAARGDILAARRMLELFEMDIKWQQVALLEIAWVAGTNPSEEVRRQARSLRMEVAATINDLPKDDQRQILLGWIEADLNGAPHPQGHLPPATDPARLQTMLDTAAGTSSELDISPEMLSRGLNWNLIARSTQVIGEIDELSEEMFYSYYVGPPLVSFVAAYPQDGARYLKEYLGVHTAYVYANYRYGSLWALLRPILQHPEPGWIRQTVRELLNSAFGGSSTEFEEGVPLTVIALQAAVGKAEAAGQLLAHATRVQQEAQALRPGREHGDTWGRYKRLLATLAQIQTSVDVFIGSPSHTLLNDALSIHYGYAGYHAPACLALAEAISVCHPPEEAHWIAWSLDNARQAAHNIQEGTFCARMTARINAMREHWWSQADLNVAAELDRLKNEPRSERLASVHHVGDNYADRRDPPKNFPLPDWVLHANKLSMLATAYQRGLPEFQRLNRNWQPEQEIPPGTDVHVPDPGLIPMVAARLAARTLATPALTDQKRVELIRSLVPFAAANPTALDTVLTRLLLAEKPTDAAILNRLAALAPMPAPGL